MKIVLFVCIGNSCRSQMAEGFAKHHGRGLVEAHSAGTMPADRVSGKATKVMSEVGIDISGQFPKAIDPAIARKADYVVSMGCGVQSSCPLDIWQGARDWGIEDPYGSDLDNYRKVRDEIERKVLELLAEIRSGQSAAGER